MGTLRLVMGDQLSHSISSLDDLDSAQDTVLMVEADAEISVVPHHKQKVVLILSAMRHFARELTERGIAVDYVRLDDPANTQSFTSELRRAVKRHGASRLVFTEPSEHRVASMVPQWRADTGIDVVMCLDTRFFCSQERFARWAEGRKLYRMEFFYREMRRESGLLMQGETPEGGAWNFDSENRKRLPAETRLPGRARFAPDAVTQKVMDMVAARYPGHFGTLDAFGWAVTRADALAALDHFITDCLPHFGDYQDAMKTGEAFVFHSLLSPYINVGLLLPREVCERAESAYRAGRAPLNATEGFIRQILGWREYVRGLYWLKMPAYAQSNALGAHRPLPWFYWSGETAMACVADTVAVTRRFAYAHHIQRLMITGNFALLAGIEPREVEEWYLAVYADAFEWVELPNTHGMALFADGGLLASKPYAASGSYINRMSDYCRECAYDPEVKSGPRACPFNFLYWNFLIENRSALEKNPRMAMPYRALAKIDPKRLYELKRDAAAFLADMDGATKPQRLI